MVKVVTVLSEGGGFNAEHVWNLIWQIRYNAKVDVHFYCLADCRVPLVATLPSVSGFKGWWAKVELFRSGLFGPNDQVFFFDLDTVITGNLDKLLRSRPRFAMMKPFNPKAYRSSCLMSWHGDYSDVYKSFMQQFGAEAQKEENRRHGIAWYRGDQRYISDAVEKLYHIKIGIVNDHVNMASYKHHCREGGRPPDGTDIVCFHGDPQPWDVEDEWVMEARGI